MITPPPDLPVLSFICRHRDIIKMLLSVVLWIVVFTTDNYVLASALSLVGLYLGVSGALGATDKLKLPRGAGGNDEFL